MAKIVEINTTSNPSNAVGRLIGELSRGLITAGHDCVVATGRDAADISIGSKFTSATHMALSWITDSEGLHSRSATRRLVKQLDALQPDVVHLHNLHGHYLHLPTLFRWLSSWGGKVVLTLHDCWWLTGHCAQYVQHGCRPSGNICAHCSHTRTEYPFSFACRGTRNYVLKKRLIASLKDLTLIAPSQWVADEVAESYLADVPIKVIHNGVDLDVFKPFDNPEPKHGILAVAQRWTASKRLDHIIDLANSGRAPQPITVVGDLMSWRLPANITHIDSLEAPELREIMARSAVMINPSSAETFGMVTLEAMACGTPVIVNNATASPMLVANGGGIAINTANTRFLAETVRDITEHPNQFAPRHRAQDFPIATTVARYIAELTK